ncbi:MAG: prepilin-type N-terminal cleavage/methylation domain-containing protein [Nitrospina sp.]|jgi:prepilin-type N-terminal cleavage/methylation domain-containing protein|nr:prepilin-type N-terminal cleavage/methylation domain-containing protein [Nitrospina sp.]
MKNQVKIKGRNFKNQCGFTLIEMISAIVLLGIMGIFSTQFITSITQSARQTTGQKGLVDDGKLALEYLIREVRVASEENNDIVYSDTGSAASITFDKFVSYSEDDSKTGITYSWNSGTKTLTRTSGTDGTTPGTVTTLATQITSFTVAETPSVGSDFYIFTMTLQGPNGENFTLQSGVRPRSTTI